MGKTFHSLTLAVEEIQIVLINVTLVFTVIETTHLFVWKVLKR